MTKCEPGATTASALASLFKMTAPYFFGQMVMAECGGRGGFGAALRCLGRFNPMWFSGFSDLRKSVAPAGVVRLCTLKALSAIPDL
jgi:hypothetical protein